MGLRIKTKIRLFLFFSLIILFVMFAFSLLNAIEYSADDKFDESYFEYFAQNSVLAISGLQREMTIYIMNLINENGLYVYAARDAKMKEFLELECRDSLEYEMETTSKEIQSNLDDMLSNITYYQKSNLLIGKETDVNNIINAVYDYFFKKENNSFSALSIKEIISYYKQLTNEIIYFNEQIKILSKNNKTKLFMNDYLSLMNLNYSIGLMYGSSAYLAYYKIYDKDIYDDFINAVENYDEYLDYFVNMYETYANSYVISRYLHELKEDGYMYNFKEYVLEQYKYGNSSKKDEVFIYLHEYDQKRHKYFNTIYDICDKSNYSFVYKNMKSSNKKESILIDYTLKYLNFITLWTLILYFSFIIVLNILFFINSSNLKKVKKYLIEIYSLRNDLSLERHIIIGDTKGKIGKTIIQINKFITNIVCIKKEKNNKSETL